MSKTFYLTTAIDYTNGPPHIGHAYEKVLADVIARYHRLKGEKVYFLTGVDQHGQKVQQSAERAGVSPQQFVDELTAKFIALWEKLEIRYDGWAATTDPLHKRCVQGMLQRLYDEGEIYKDKQEGYYSIRQEQFLTEKERGPDGEFGPEWGEVEHRIEENYYFRLIKHKEWLLSHLRSHPHCITPEFRQAELINALEKLTGDLCISRPKSRLSWGIELPFDRDYVNYVWFDALTNYISFIGYDPSKSYADQSSAFLEKWPALHIIGKDILVPAHGIYWPIMLHALGFPDEGTPTFLVHGWWNVSGTKMSKSLGNVIDPAALADKYGAAPLRYYLIEAMVVGQDTDFSEEQMLTRFNSALANSIGNLLSRTLTMIWKYRAGKVRQIRSDDERLTTCRTLIQTEITGYLKAFGDGKNEDSFVAHSIDEAAHHALMSSWHANHLIENTQPYKLAKNEDGSELLDAILYTLTESLRIIAILLSPILPTAAHGIFDQLNWKMELRGKEQRFSLGEAEWGKLPDGQLVGRPTPLFPRIQADAA